MKKKFGKVSEIDILLHNLLEENGYNVKVVILSTRTNGLATTANPVISNFNYLIVQATIDGNVYYLDTTNSYVFFGQLPFRYLNQYVRLLDFKNGSSWDKIHPEKISTVLYRAQVDLDSL